MREIKFRAWSKTLKAMYWFDVTWGNSWIMGGGWLSVVPFGEDRQFHPPNIMAIDPQESELMQFTGLHDKNNKEVWEGDIVKFETLDAINNQTLVGAIKYSEHGTRFGVEIEHRGLLQFYPNYTEVIGNIHENPDLLK